jgi:hypothetical protein
MQIATDRLDGLLLRKIRMADFAIVSTTSISIQAS